MENKMREPQGNYGFAVGDWVEVTAGPAKGEVFQLVEFVPTDRDYYSVAGYWRGDSGKLGVWDDRIKPAPAVVRENKPHTVFPAHVEGRYGDSDWFKAGGFNSELTAESAKDNFFAKMWPDFEFRVVTD